MPLIIENTDSFLRCCILGIYAVLCGYFTDSSMLVVFGIIFGENLFWLKLYVSIYPNKVCPNDFGNWIGFSRGKPACLIVCRHYSFIRFRAQYFRFKNK